MTHTPKQLRWYDILTPGGRFVTMTAGYNTQDALIRANRSASMIPVGDGHWSVQGCIAELTPENIMVIGPLRQFGRGHE